MMTLQAPLKWLAGMLALATMAGYSPYGDPFVIEGEGTWTLTSKQTMVYENGTLVLDETRTDSLGEWEFLRSGRGYLREASGVVDTVVWDESPEDNRLVIYRRIGPWINAAITERTDDGMNLYWVVESGEGSVLRRTESRATIVRAR
jgi:mannose-6-phosphate isomerase-like protein (cupin superfamily)